MMTEEHQWYRTQRDEWIEQKEEVMRRSTRPKINQQGQQNQVARVGVGRKVGPAAPNDTKMINDDTGPYEHQCSTGPA